MKARVWGALALLMALPMTAGAFEVAKVNVNGFLSQGYLRSYTNNFLSDSRGGNSQFNELGLTFTSQVTEKLRIGAQILSRDLGDMGNNETRLDWGNADYRLSDALGIRLGKNKLPFGLYNEGRDSDFMRAMIFLPQSLYDEGNRDIYVSYQGGGLYGSLPLGAAGDLEYQVYAGQLSFPDDSATKQAFFVFAEGAAKGINLKTGGFLGLNESMVDADISTKYLYGGTLVYNTPVEGLRLGLSYMKGEADIDYDAAGPDVFGNNRYKGSAEVDDRYVVSFEYAPGFMTLSAEYAENNFPITLYEGTAFEYTAQDWKNQAWYVMLTVPVTDALSVSAMYDEFYENKDDKDGDAFAAMGEPKFLGYRKDLGVGIRYDVNFNWVLKAEYHVVEGNFSTVSVFDDSPEEDWAYYALKASFVF